MRIHLNKHISIIRVRACVLACAVAAGMTAASCSSPSVSEQKDDLEQAQALIERLDYRSAQSICDEIRQYQTKGDARDAKVLGRLSILYVKLSDAGGHEENILKNDEITKKREK